MRRNARSTPKSPVESTRVAAYLRVSTTMQVEGGESLDVQHARLVAEAERRGLEPVIYRDEGASAGNTERPAYQRMISDLRAGKVGAVMATKLDRLWRSIMVALQEIEELTTAGVSLIILDQNFDTTTAVGKMTLNILLAFAQFERDMCGERVIEGMLARARAGKWNGGPIPYGYRLDKESRKLIIDEGQAEVVRLMFRMATEGKSRRQIRNALNDAGHKTARGHRWPNETVARILGSEIYKGTLCYNRRNTTGGKKVAVGRPPDEHIKVPGAVPAIVPADQFDRAQAILSKWSPLAPRTQAAPYLLGGLVRCEYCGKNMYGHTTRHRVGDELREYAHYRCYSRNRYGKESCRGNTVPCDELEQVVEAALFGLRVNPERLRELETEEQASKRTGIPALKRRVSRLETALAGIDAKEERVMSAFEEGTYSAEDMKSRRARHQEERERTRHQVEDARLALEVAERCSVDLDCLLRLLVSAYDEYQERDFDGRRELLCALCHHISVTRTEGTIVLRADLHEGLFEADSDRLTFEIDPAKTVRWENADGAGENGVYIPRRTVRGSWRQSASRWPDT